MAEETGGNANLLGPEAVLMLTLACMIDGGELVIEHIPGVGQIISVALDIFAFLFFGVWMVFRNSSGIRVPSRTKAKATKLAKRIKWLRPFFFGTKKIKWLRPLCFGIELIPIFSSYLPFWILIVFLELKNTET